MIKKMKLTNHSFAITVFVSIILLSTPITMSDTLAQQSESKIPSWVKNNAGWWADDSIDGSSFAQGLEYLIKEDAADYGCGIWRNRNAFVCGERERRRLTHKRRRTRSFARLCKARRFTGNSEK